jgi:hypothetical protein
VGAELHHIGRQPQRRVYWKEPGTARDVFLQGIILQRAPELCRRDALPGPHGQVHGEDWRRGGIDREVGADFVQGNAVKQELHVGQRVNGYADPPHLFAHPRIVRIKANLRRQIEGHTQAGHALVEQGPVARVAVLCRAKAGVLPKRPQPAAIHGGIDAACEGKCARVAQVALVRDVLDVLRGVERRHFHAPGRLHWCRGPRGHAALPAGVRRLRGLRLSFVFHGCLLHCHAAQRLPCLGAGSMIYHSVLLGNWATAVPRADKAPSWFSATSAHSM